MGAERGAGGAIERQGRRLRRALSECSSEATAYGACVRSSVPDVQHLQCDREFAALRQCAKRAIHRLRSP
jgi:hypothetical protein